MELYDKWFYSFPYDTVLRMSGCRCQESCINLQYAFFLSDG